jgi:hypothetical protein
MSAFRFVLFWTQVRLFNVLVLIGMLLALNTYFGSRGGADEGL